MSPWASPLVLVKKKDRQTRWVTDLRELNKQTVKDSYPSQIYQRSYTVCKVLQCFRLWMLVELDRAMKEVDTGQGLLASYLDNILTYSGEPCANFRHLTQVVLSHGAAGIKKQP